MNVSEAPSRQRSGNTARERSRLATRARLLASGRALFAERGFHGVTSHEIAKAAGVAAGTFYLHFADKQALFREIVDEAIRRLRERLQAAFESTDDPRGAVAAHAEALVSFSEENADLVHIVFGRDHRDVDIEADVLDYLATVGADMLRDRIARGAMRTALDPAVASQALTGMFARVIAWWVESGMKTSRETMIKTLVGIQLQGLYEN